MRPKLSRQRKRIVEYCKKKGITIESLNWEPLGTASEMCGRSGGWELIDVDGEAYLGENVDLLLEDIDLTLIAIKSLFGCLVKIKVIATEIAPEELHPGDLYSTQGQNYWDRMDDTGMFSEKIQIRTNVPMASNQKFSVKLYKITLLEMTKI